MYKKYDTCSRMIVILGLLLAVQREKAYVGHLCGFIFHKQGIFVKIAYSSFLQNNDGMPLPVWGL